MRNFGQILSPCFYCIITQGGYEVGEKKFPEFSRLFESHKLTFPEVIATKCNNDLHQGSYDRVYPVNSCFTQTFEWRIKNTLFVKICPWGCTEFPENSLSFPCSEKSLSIPGFPGLWPPCHIIIIRLAILTAAAASSYTNQNVIGRQNSSDDRHRQEQICAGDVVRYTEQNETQSLVPRWRQNSLQFSCI